MDKTRSPRPLVGHASIGNALERCIRKGTVGHAYLFFGPAEVGKKTVAERFAAALLCEIRSADGSACDACRSCKQRLAGVHPDFHVVEPATDGARGVAAIKLEQVRHLLSRIKMRPVAGSRTVALIAGAGDLNLQAANALLKTIEEPPAGATVILTASALDRLPPTIVSRCRVFRFSTVPLAAISDELRQQGFSRRDAETLAALSGGRPGRAFAYAQNRALWERVENEFSRFERLRQSGLSERLRLAADELFGRGESNDTLMPVERLSVWTAAARDCLLHEAGCSHFCQRPDKNRATGSSGGGAVFPWRIFLDRLSATLSNLRQNANPRLALETLLLDLPPA